MSWVPFKTQHDVANGLHIATVRNPNDKPVKDVRGRSIKNGLQQRIVPLGVYYRLTTVELYFADRAEGEVAL